MVYYVSVMKQKDREIKEKQKSEAVDGDAALKSWTRRRGGKK